MCNPNPNSNPNTPSSACTTDTASASVAAAGAAPQPHLYLPLMSLTETIISSGCACECKDGNQPTTKQNKPIIFPSHTQVLNEIKSLFQLSLPIAATALLLYSRSILSMLFLGSLGDLELAAGALAIAFANITGYSVLSGLALGMEPLCSQAFGARRHKLLSLTLQRTVLFLLSSSLPISILWINMSRIMSYLGQDPSIAALSQRFLLFSLPDLVSYSFIHPIRIYLRAQGITHPLTFASFAAALLHFPINWALVTHMGLGVEGVAAASAASNLILLLLLVFLVWGFDIHSPTWTAPSRDCLSGWRPLILLATPSCVSVCLEWWWYEIMILLCGLLSDPKSAVASMGILIQTTALVYVFPSSLGFGVSTRVGNELGAKRPDRARASAAVAVSIAGLMGLVAAGFAAAMRDKWGWMFTEDNEILRLTSAALPIVGLCELGNCPQTVGCGVLRGSARPSAAANVNLGAFYLVGMPVAVGLEFWIGVGFTGLWLGLLAAQVCCAGLMLYVVGTTDWDAQATRAQLLTCAGGALPTTTQNATPPPPPPPQPQPQQISLQNDHNHLVDVDEERPLITIKVAHS